jgi:DNA end-binding protein Ku
MASSVWKGQISFGLVTIPVRLLRAARSERVPLRELYRVSATGSAPGKPDDESGDEEDESPRLAPAAPARGPMCVAPKGAKPETAPPQVKPVYEPVRRVATGQASEQPAPDALIAKDYEYEQGRDVTLESEELRSMVPPTSPDMEIVEFVRLAESTRSIWRAPTM